MSRVVRTPTQFYSTEEEEKNALPRATLPLPDLTHTHPTGSQSRSRKVIISFSINLPQTRLQSKFNERYIKFVFLPVSRAVLCGGCPKLQGPVFGPDILSFPSFFFRHDHRLDGRHMASWPAHWRERCLGVFGTDMSTGCIAPCDTKTATPSPIWAVTSRLMFYVVILLPNINLRSLDAKDASSGAVSIHGAHQRTFPGPGRYKPGEQE